MEEKKRFSIKAHLDDYFEKIWKGFKKHPFLYSVVVLIVCVTAIVHPFGPYRGKVVDLETGAPIEGAAVLIVFFTETFFSVTSYADAVETVTDEKGEFRIWWRLATTFHPLNKWKPDGYVTIFKPGYGAYPGHDDVSPMFVPNGTIPESQYVTFRLPRLVTVEERKKNMWSVWPCADVSKSKTKYLSELLDEERANIGLID